MRKNLMLLVSLVLFVMALDALELGKVTLPDELQAGDNILQLNGAGWRKKLIIKVYAGALYLTEKSSSAEEILNNDLPIIIRMHFVYDGVTPEKLVSAWNEGFANAAVADSLQPKIDTFNALFTETAQSDDIYDIVYLPGVGTSLYVNDIIKGTIPGFEFRKAVYSIWLGENTALASLRDKMLGN